MSPSAVQLVQTYAPIVKTGTRERYAAHAYTAPQPGGLWEAWLVFFSLKTGSVLATDRETTQSTREHVLYWATGLGPTYLQGALQRALDRRPEGELRRRTAREARRGAFALAEAEIYAKAPDSLRRRRLAGRRR